MITGSTKLAKPLTAACMLLFLLTACGGGGGGGGFIPDDGDDNAVLQIALSLTDSAGNPTNTISSSSPGTLTVTVTSAPSPGADEDPVADEVVTANTDIATIEPDTGSTLTDENGVAEFTVLAATALGADTIEVTVEGPDGPVTATINFEVIAGNTLELALLDPTGNPTNLITATRPGTLIATVTTTGANPQPVESEIVRVTTDIGVIDPPSGSALTNADGEATFEIQAGDEFGAGAGEEAFVGGVQVVGGQALGVAGDV